MKNQLPPALQFLQRLWRLNHVLEQRSLEMEGRLGITAQQRFLIRCIGRFPGITPGEVADIMHVDPATISVAVRKLEAKGLLERARDLSDSRRVILGLTEEGKRLDRPAPRTVESGVQGFLDDLSETDVDALHDMLDGLADAIAAEERPAASRSARRGRTR